MAEARQTTDHDEIRRSDESGSRFDEFVSRETTGASGYQSSSARRRSAR